ncbi:hypothetical protein HDU93_001198 [Gonapodya sp. JEL0774]|nr:hypothetical protein HDU93_001198 [Gonapodya sp. JEL0774]
MALYDAAIALTKAGPSSYTAFFNSAMPLADTQYLTPCFADKLVFVTIEITRRSRRFSFVRAKVEQDNPNGMREVCVDASGCYGLYDSSTVPGDADYSISEFLPSPLPSPASCIDFDLALHNAGVYPLSPNAINEFRIKLVDPNTSKMLEPVGRRAKLGNGTPLVEAMDVKLGAWVGFGTYISRVLVEKLVHNFIERSQM